ncbi:putative nrps-t1pks biosynthetic cluster [Metarhizium rileyi]|uniref:Putative nrps-t1pks biosynthetic cluster n=1 Tax=Metarhizium rileyi (strain RCEF 4871) TaxID=1649241 RepID=A0A5C6GIH0_METRR|nr:putative nrps-t1pks biosynthetic cluster [Metarhizium rileyi]
MTFDEPIAIVGTSCRFAGGANTPSKLWELLRCPRDVAQEVPVDRYDVNATHHQDAKHHGTTNVREAYFLEEEISAFDSGFFAIQPGEADAIDPQQRMLMETVYDSLCEAGLTIEQLRGSSTAVYVGVMCDDWAELLNRDVEVFPQYGATGVSRSIMSNRISYFFDWHGPSMTIDTACSSSLISVHLAIQALRSGESEVAIAAGANLILSPGMFIAESKLSMVSPNGRSRMWDSAADGYARGEGIAAVVLKPLSKAIRDNDHIECLIRGTGINQDGRTPGLTMPSATAQAELIAKTYARAGLDINKPEHRPQFFQAHGTGTPAGDPQEAEAIYKAFYATTTATDTLYVGSVKTVLGHTEGTAGLAGLIASSLAIQNSTIPPNMHFEELNPRIKPFYDHLHVPTTAVPWPKLMPGQARRVSINSFGFGGTNAHAIIESYEPPSTTPSQASTPLTPLTFSASSESSLRSILSQYAEYIRSGHTHTLHELSYCLQTRRSTLPFRVAFSARSLDDAAQHLDSLLSEERESTIGIRQVTRKSHKIMGVFTGQGAQWARMGAKLVEASPYVAERLSQLDEALRAEFIVAPSWTLRGMILADTETSRVKEAEISQPLCTAIQIVLVDLLRFAGIELKAVVGHSSGEIGAAYAAGIITAQDAIRVAYLRGQFAKYAKSPNGKKGAMMAVDTTFEDGTEFCNLESFKGRIQVAAHNSPSSLTLSGDEDAVLEAVEVFNDEGKFNRRLHVDTAYHSSHVYPCAEPYLAAMGKWTTESKSTGTTWYSSVHQGQIMTPVSTGPQYWVDNMTNPVLFSSAVAAAWTNEGPFDLVLEIGPHPALQKPCLNTLDSLSNDDLPPYFGLLRRGKDDALEFSNALGSIWTHLGPNSVSFQKLTEAISSTPIARTYIPNLPRYPFDHSRNHAFPFRKPNKQAPAQVLPHPLLGKRCFDRETTRTRQWRNVLHTKEISWLFGHKIENHLVLPATAYVSMAVEAINLAAGDAKIGLISIEQLHIRRAIAFFDDNSGVETLFQLTTIKHGTDEIRAEFSISSCDTRDVKSTLALNANGVVSVTLADPEHNTLPGLPSDELGVHGVDIDRFYRFLEGVGYNYAPPFRGIRSIQRKASYSQGTIVNEAGDSWEDKLMIHPGMLDTALQTVFAAFCCPGDERLWGLHLPTVFRTIRINPYYSLAAAGREDDIRFVSVVEDYNHVRLVADVNLFAAESNHAFLHMDHVELVPLQAGLPQNDASMFFTFECGPMIPNGDILNPHNFSHKGWQAAADIERICFFYMRQLLQSVTSEDRANTLPHYCNLLDWAAHAVSLVVEGKNEHIRPDAQNDTKSDIEKLIKRHYERVEVRLIESVCENLPRAVKESSSILEYMLKDNMLDDFYANGMDFPIINDYAAQMIRQIAHRYPQMNILEIGAGTGGSTRMILPLLGSSFETYTFTDISSGFFETAKERFQDYEDRMVYKTFNMNKTPESQGFVEGSYDLIFASNVLHATQELDEMMKNVRSLLKPGGYLIMLEVVSNDALRIGLPMGGLPGWWLGAETGRTWGPTLTLPQWDDLLQRHGFGGIDTTSPVIHRILPVHVFAAQAVDDRVDMLRSPLETVDDFPSSTSDLVIIGGETLNVHKACDRLQSLVQGHFGHVRRFRNILSLNEEGLAESSAVLMLAELDRPLFADMSAEKLEALKTLWRQGGNILWVTQGAKADSPHSNMSLGIGRCVRWEHPNITLQSLDVDNLSHATITLIAEQMLRIGLLAEWSRKSGQEELLWSVEPEVYVENGLVVVPRAYPHKPANSRYNTCRRAINEPAKPQEECIRFTTDGKWGLQFVSPLRIPAELPWPTRRRAIHVTHFLLSTVNVGPGARLMVCAGFDASSRESVIALSHVTESLVTVPSEWSVTVEEASKLSILAATSAYLSAESLLQLTNKGDVLVVHEPHSAVWEALKCLAGPAEVKVHATTSKRDNAQPEWQYVDKYMPSRLMKSKELQAATKFVNLSRGGGASVTNDRLRECLSEHCELIDGANFNGSKTEIRACSSEADVSRVLRLAVSRAAAHDEDVLGSNVSTIQLQDISTDDIAGGCFAIADCEVSSVSANVCAIDRDIIFSSDKTYFLVGLAGDLGQSICSWMVHHGARYIVLTSRNPKVHPDFIRKLEQVGATVKVLSMDITSRKDLESCHDTITKCMPPIAGVANGAMVLEDCLFENMSFESLTRVLKPKVLGTQLLDELFYNTPLDFFILFSSVAAAMGNTGQSNYIAGNMYMSSLAAQRKKRGLPASSIDISSVIGLGYVERSETLSEDTFKKMGYNPMSEQDMHALFAEAILLGKDKTSGSCELLTGLSPKYSDENVHDQILKDAKFGHFVRRRTKVDMVSGGTTGIPIRAQLSKLKNYEEVVNAVKDSFIGRLRRILSVSPEETIHESLTLVEQGVDSLMAVEVRTWFFSELQVDFPVLKILGGHSIRDLINEAIKLLPSSIVDISALGTGAAVAAPEKQEVGHSEPASKGEMKLTSSPNQGSSIEATSPTLAPSHTEVLHTEKVALTMADDYCRPEVTRRQEEPNVTAVLQNDHIVNKQSLHNGRGASKPNGRAPSPRRHVKPQASCEMSFGQAGFWFLDQYIPNKTVFNMTAMLKLTGSLRINALERALRELGKRHEILRTRFRWSSQDNEQNPKQIIHYESTIRLVKASVSTDAEAQATMQTIHNEEWDLARGEPMKMLLLSKADKVHFLIFSTHHIFLDGYSLNLLFSEFESLYRNKRLPALGLDSQYRQFALYQRQLYNNGGWNHIIKHYRETFPSEFKPIGLLPFAKSSSRHAPINYSQHEATIRIPADFAAKLRQVAGQNRSTAFHVYLSALQALLFQLLPDTDDIFIGMADSNRRDKKFMGSLGLFLNMIPLRFQRQKPGIKITSAITNARDVANSALEFSQIPFDMLLRELNVARSNHHSPIYQVYVDYNQNFKESLVWGECKIESRSWRYANTGYDISLEISGGVDADTAITLKLQDAFYSEESTHLLLRSYISLLEFMVKAPTSTIDRIPLWSSYDTQRALDVGQATRVEQTWPQTIGHRIDEMKRLHGSSIALKDGHGEVLTYEQLGARVDAICYRLRASGAARGSVVGVFQRPSADWICSMLAIFKAGSIYVPLDLRNTLPRVRSFCKVARPSIILTDASTTTTVSELGANGAVELLVSDVISPVEPQKHLAQNDDHAAILFTSGSTGEPKGVVLSHSNLVTFFEMASRTFELPEDNLVVLQQSPFTFDFSLLQTLTALTGGGCLYVVPAESRGDPMEISRIMANEKITYTAATPLEYSMWIRYGAERLQQCTSWNFALSGGESMSDKLLKDFANLNLPGLRVFNGYGPMEATIIATQFEVKLHQSTLSSSVPAGFMLPGYSVCILDANQKPVPLGVPGEIAIGGPCIVPGYFDNVGVTDQKFVPDSFFGTSGRLFRTGDRGRLFKDGQLSFEGRLGTDTLVKLRGIRTELFEIENSLLKSAEGALAHAVVSLRGSGEDAYLAAHVVFSQDYAEHKRESFAQTLCEKLPLPPYMRPSVTMILDDIPRTPHLKLDRKAIQLTPVSLSPAESSVSRSLTPTERELGDLWKQVLPLDPGHLSAESDFFRVGGNSILLVGLQAMIKNVFSVAPRLNDLLETSSLSGMAATIDSGCLSSSINWETETRIPQFLRRDITSPKAPAKTCGLTMLFTGATGYLGRHLVTELCEDEKIDRIILLLRPGRVAPREHMSDKLTTVTGDVSRPNLGLTDEQFASLADTVDVIVHCAANRSFWDSYEVLKPDNFDSVKELARLAVNRSVPLHVLSSGAVTSNDVDSGPPRGIGDGYTATKWAVEAFLRQASSTSGIPVSIHRPMGVANNGFEDKDTLVKKEVAIQDFIDIAKQMGAQPSFDGVTGSVDVVPVERFVKEIHSALSTGSTKAFQVLRYEAQLRLSVDDLKSRLRMEKQLVGLAKHPLLQWTGMAKKAGLKYFIAAQNLVIVSAHGTLVSRR